MFCCWAVFSESLGSRHSFWWFSPRLLLVPGGSQREQVELSKRSLDFFSKRAIFGMSFVTVCAICRHFVFSPCRNIYHLLLLCLGCIEWYCSRASQLEPTLHSDNYDDNHETTSHFQVDSLDPMCGNPLRRFFSSCVRLHTTISVLHIHENHNTNSRFFCKWQHEWWFQWRNCGLPSFGWWHFWQYFSTQSAPFRS